MTWSLLYTKQAKKDAKRIEQAGLGTKYKTYWTSLPKIRFRILRRMKNWLATLLVPIHDASTFSIDSCIKFWRNSKR